MHDQARAWVTTIVQTYSLEDAEVLDLGGRAVNGTIHDLFTTRPFVVDVRPGFGVDLIADAAEWTPHRTWDVVLCTEVFEHTARWADILRTAFWALHPGGMLIATCASRSRPPHSAVDGGALRHDEWYRNIPPEELTAELALWPAYGVVEADGVFGDDDLYCWAVR